MGFSEICSQIRALSWLKEDTYDVLPGGPALPDDLRLLLANQEFPIRRSWTHHMDGENHVASLDVSSSEQGVQAFARRVLRVDLDTGARMPFKQGFRRLARP
jgi:hypothetical protein